MAYLLGIDAGTTMVKTALFDEEKGAVASAAVDCSFSFMDENETKIAKEHIEKRKKGISEERDVEFIHKSGNKIYTRIRASPIFDKQGQVTKVAIVARDITERKEAELALKEAEERYGAVIKQSADCIFLVDPVFDFRFEAACGDVHEPGCR